MHFRQLAVATLILFAIRPISAEECHECTRAGNYGGRPVPLGLVAPHPVLHNDFGPQLVAPANHPSDSIAQAVRMNDSNVRLASNESDVPTAAPRIRVNDVIAVVKKECSAAGNCNKSECESCCKKCESNCKECESCCKDYESSCTERNSPSRIAVEVIEALPNGNLVINGRAQTMHAGQIRERSLTGDISPQSITPYPCVDQQDVAKLRIRVRNCNQDAGGDIRPVSAQEVMHDEAISPAAARSALLHEKEAQLASLQQEVDRLRGEGARTRQILVKVQMLEVSLTKLRKMGFEFSVPGKNFTPNSISDIQNIISNSPVPISKAPEGASRGIVDWLCENRVAKELASPQIVTLSGRPAQFCVGNEIPIPKRGDSATSSEFQKVGTQVDLLACDLGEDRVHLEVRTRVSNVDESRSVCVGDSVVPAVSVREGDTAIETKFNQSTVLCGGIENRTESVRNVGEDGASKIVDENNEVALIVIVTPEAVGSIVDANHDDATGK